MAFAGDRERLGRALQSRGTSLHGTGGGATSIHTSNLTLRGDVLLGDLLGAVRVYFTGLKSFLEIS